MRNKITALLLGIIFILNLGAITAAAEEAEPEETLSPEEEEEQENARILNQYIADSAPMEDIIELSYSTDDVQIENVRAACVYNVENETFVYNKNADAISFPATTVKVMTAILAMEALGDEMDRQIELTRDHFSGPKGASVALRNGEIVTVKDLIYALLVGNASDAANALAFEIAGGTEQFVEMMNNKAREIGCVNTNFTNPSGVHNANMHTTARDMALITAYASKINHLVEISTVERYTMEATNKSNKRTIFNRNCFFSSYAEYAYVWSVPQGINAGVTEDAGYCISTTATRDGLTYAVVILGAISADNNIFSYSEAAKLISWVFKAYSYRTVIGTSDAICEIPVKLSSKDDSIALYPEKDVELFLPNSMDIKSELELNYTLDSEFLEAPISDGTQVGTVTVSFKGDTLGTFKLVTGVNVSRNNILFVLDMVKKFLTSTPVIMLAIIAVVIAIGYIVLLIIARRKRN